MTKASNTGGRTAPAKRGRKQVESNEEADLQIHEEPTTKKTKTARRKLNLCPILRRAHFSSANSKRTANAATGDAQPAERESTKPALFMTLPFDIQTEVRRITFPQ